MRSSLQKKRTQHDVEVCVWTDQILAGRVGRRFNVQAPGILYPNHVR